MIEDDKLVGEGHVDGDVVWVEDSHDGFGHSGGPALGLLSGAGSAKVSFEPKICSTRSESMWKALSKIGTWGDAGLEALMQ